MTHQLSGPETANLESENCRVVSAGFGELGGSLTEHCPYPHRMQSQGIPARTTQEIWLSVPGTAQISIQTQDKSARRIQAESKGNDWPGPKTAGEVPEELLTAPSHNVAVFTAA